jgi:hypothetical protein
MSPSPYRYSSLISSALSELSSPWFVVIYVKDFTLVLKQAATIPPARDTAEDVNTTLSLLGCPVNVVGCD